MATQSRPLFVTPVSTLTLTLTDTIPITLTLFVYNWSLCFKVMFFYGSDSLELVRGFGFSVFNVLAWCKIISNTQFQVLAYDRIFWYFINSLMAIRAVYKTGIFVLKFCFLWVLILYFLGLFCLLVLVNGEVLDSL